MRYRDNMTPAETTALLAEIAALDDAMAGDTLHNDGDPCECAECGGDPVYEDEMDTLRKAALNRGQP